MGIVFAVLGFLFARQLGRVLGYILGMTIAALAMVVAGPFLLLPGAFRRWKARRARRLAARVERREVMNNSQAGVMNNSHGPSDAPGAPQRPKAPVIPLHPRKRP